SKVATALKSQIDGHFRRDLNLLAFTKAVSGHLVSGRQIMFLIEKRFKSKPVFDESDSVEQLLNLECAGIAQLETYVTSWKQIIQDMPKSLNKMPKSIFRNFFHKQLSRVSELGKPFLDRFDQFPEGRKKKSYAWLYSKVDDFLERRRQDVQRKARNSAYKGAKEYPSAAAELQERDDKAKKAKEEKQRKRKEKHVETLALAAKGKGKGSAKDKGPTYCFLFQVGKCSKGKECSHRHDCTIPRCRSTRSCLPKEQPRQVVEPLPVEPQQLLATRPL
ncbi:unnamed protein product, partial [Polarella glacialis]